MQPGAAAQFPPADHTFTQHGHTVHYACMGHGTPVVLIHGSLCDYRYWRWQLPALGQQWRVIAPSLRGYWPGGVADEDGLFSIDQHAADMAAFIQGAFYGQPVHLLGHSRGAQVALELALRAPSLVRTLTLADPGFRLDGEAETPMFHGEMAALLDAGETEAALSGFIDKVNGPGTWRQMTSWFKTMVRDNARTLLLQAIEAHPAVCRDDLTALHCPLLLVGGAHSAQRYQSRLDGLQALLPAATRVTIPMAAHGMNLANPRAFNEAVAGFLAQCQPQASRALT